MTIYLACTVRGDRSALAAARRICAGLEARGHAVLTGHLLEDHVDEAEGRLTHEAVFERDLEWLGRCDALVAEASGSSFGVGFEVGYVLARAPVTGQRVFLVYDAARRSAVSRLISGNTDPNCRLLAYARLDEIDSFIERHFPEPAPGTREREF
jgi:nucleoside 2-deoxyribosyltransferase